MCFADYVSGFHVKGLYFLDVRLGEKWHFQAVAAFFIHQITLYENKKTVS
jgi:hypothetical protein